MEPLRYDSMIVEAEVSPSMIINSLAESSLVKNSKSCAATRTWYDSFDWRLHRAKKMLVKQGGNWTLQNFTGKQVASCSNLRKQARFFWDFPAPELQSQLSSLLNLRALLEIGKEDYKKQELLILNRDEKIVVRLYLKTSLSQVSGNSLTMLDMEEVRGYGKHFDRVKDILSANFSLQPGSLKDIFNLLAADYDREPLAYSSGYDLQLSPKTPALDAVKLIYQYLLEVIRQNEFGVIADIDTEFLHDLRVAVRRTRSGLSLIKGVINNETVTRFKDEFRYVGQITGPVRDLDVYLLSREDYKKLLPEPLHPGLEYFFRDLASKRKREQKKLVTALKGKRYNKIIGDWQSVLTELDNYPGENADIPIKLVADQIIYKRFRRVLKDGRLIDATSPDKDLHRLRIQGKKLRYCLEFFASFYEKKKMKQLLKQLKVLQNNLGDFNDLSIQQDMIKKYLGSLKPGSARSMAVSASLGGLLASLQFEHQRVRSGFGKTFEMFATRENIDLYKQLFITQDGIVTT